MLWGDKTQHAFQELKRLHFSAPVLAFPTRVGAFILDTDASNDSIGAVFSQKVDDGSENVIAYYS